MTKCRSLSPNSSLISAKKMLKKNVVNISASVKKLKNLNEKIFTS